MTVFPYVSRWYGKREQDERFDQRLLEHVMISPEPQGNIQVECRFRFNKSQWGTFADEHHDPRPGGIIYLDLDFHQPGDSRLKFATVQLTLDDKDAELPSASEAAEAPVLVPVNISHHGPAHLVGRAIEVPKTVHHQAMPYVGVGGVVEIGGAGRESEQLFIKESRWEFSSKLGCPKNTRRRLATNQLVWEFKENPLVTKDIHSNTIHTAFAFSHSGQPFFIKVEVGGRLERFKYRARESVKHSFSSNKREDTFATTLVNFGDITRFHKPLNELAEGLPREMLDMNRVSIPWELPDTRKPPHKDLTGDEPNLVGPLGQDQIDSIANDASDSTMRSALARVHGPFIEQSDLEQFTGVTDLLTEPPPSRISTVGALGSAVASSPSRPVKGSGGSKNVQQSASFPPPDHTGHSSASAVTAVDWTPPLPPPLHATTDVAGAKERGGVELETAVEFLQICGVLAVTQAILKLLAYCGVPFVPRRDRPAIAAKKVSIDEEPKPEGRKRTRSPVESMVSG